MRLPGEFFAVKELPLDRATIGGQSAVVADLMREINLLASVEHQHIVRYIGTQRTPDKLYMFTEYVTGASLALAAVSAASLLVHVLLVISTIVLEPLRFVDIFWTPST